MLVRRNAGNPRGTRCELMFEDEFMRGEAEAFSATERTHDHDEFFIDDPGLHSSCVGRVRKGNRRRGGVHWRETGLVAFAGALHTGVTMIMITIITVDLAQHFVRQVDLRP